MSNESIYPLPCCEQPAQTLLEEYKARLEQAEECLMQLKWHDDDPTPNSHKHYAAAIKIMREYVSKYITEEGEFEPVEEDNES
jgi:hypothetical protein